MSPAIAAAVTISRVPLYVIVEEAFACLLVQLISPPALTQHHHHYVAIIY